MFREKNPGGGNEIARDGARCSWTAKAGTGGKDVGRRGLPEENKTNLTREEATPGLELKVLRSPFDRNVFKREGGRISKVEQETSIHRKGKLLAGIRAEARRILRTEKKSIFQKHKKHRRSEDDRPAQKNRITCHLGGLGEEQSALAVKRLKKEDIIASKEMGQRRSHPSRR